MSEVIFDIEVENLDSPFEREKLESLPKAILVELLVRRIKATGKAIEYIEQQRLHKFQDTIGGLTYEERKLLDIIKGVDKE